MGVPSAGQVVLVPFPFSDLSQTKVRPARCVVPVGRGDWVLCQITSNSFGDPSAVPIAADDFATGGLAVPSVVRPGKLDPYSKLLSAVAALFPSAPTS